MDCSLEGCLLVAFWTECFDLCDGGFCFESDLMDGALWIESIFYPVMLALMFCFRILVFISLI